MFNLGFSSATSVGRIYTSITADYAFSDSISNRLRELRYKLICFSLSSLASIYKECIVRITCGSVTVYIPSCNDREFSRKSNYFNFNVKYIRGILEEGYLPGGCKTFVLLSFRKAYIKNLFNKGI